MIFFLYNCPGDVGNLSDIHSPYCPKHLCVVYRFSLLFLTAYVSTWEKPDLNVRDLVSTPPHPPTLFSFIRTFSRTLICWNCWWYEKIKWCPKLLSLVEGSINLKCSPGARLFCVHQPHTYLLMEKIIPIYRKYPCFLCFAKNDFFSLTFFGFFWKYYFF